jgi:hypothetical protein
MVVQWMPPGRPCRLKETVFDFAQGGRVAGGGNRSGFEQAVAPGGA